jgi:serine/threonine protein kinase
MRAAAILASALALRAADPPLAAETGSLVEADAECAVGEEGAVNASAMEMEGAQLKLQQELGKNRAAFSKADVQAAADACESGRWSVLEYIDSGGFGDAWRARDNTRVGKTVVLKANFKLLKDFKPMAANMCKLLSNAPISVNESEMTAFERIEALCRCGGEDCGCAPGACSRIALRESECIPPMRVGGGAGAKPVLLTVMPDGGRDLFGILQSRANISHVNMRKIMADVLRGLCVLHQHGATHRDVKLDNVVWDAETEVARLIDFDFVQSFEAMKEKWDTRGSKEYFDDEFNPVKKPLSDGTHMHALDIFAAGSMYLYLMYEYALSETFANPNPDFNRAQLLRRFLRKPRPGMEEDQARIAEMMEPNSLEHPRPSACELLQKPPFSSMPLPEGIGEKLPDPTPEDFLPGRAETIPEDFFDDTVAVGANSRGVAATPVKGVLTGGITPRISDLFSKSLKLKRISEHFRNPFDLD